MTITFSLSVNPKGLHECSMQNKDVLRFILTVFNHKDVKKYLYQRLWMNKQRPISEVVDE